MAAESPLTSPSSSTALSLSPSPLSSSSPMPRPSSQHMDVNMKAMMKNLMEILEQQEVSLFSISSDDVPAGVKPHLQAVKASNMKAKDIAVALLSKLNNPSASGSLQDNATLSPSIRPTSMPYPPHTSRSGSNTLRYSLDPSTLIPSVDSLSQSSSSKASTPTISPAIRASPSSGSRFSSPPSTPPRVIVSALSLSSPSIPAPPLTASPPASPVHAGSAPSSPSPSPSQSLEGISSPRTKKLNIFRRYTEYKLSKSAELPPPKTRRRGFTLFQSADNTKLAGSPSTPSNTKPPSPNGLRKTLSLPVASSSVAPSPPQSPSRDTPEPPKFVVASPSKKGERAGYPLMHEQSKILFAKKLESLRASQGDVY